MKKNLIIFSFFTFLFFSCDKKTKNTSSTTSISSTEGCQQNYHPRNVIIYNPNAAITDVQRDSLELLGLKQLRKCDCDLGLELWGDTLGSDIFGSDGLANGGDSGTRGGSGDDANVKNGYSNGSIRRISPNIQISPDYFIKAPIENDTNKVNIKLLDTDNNPKASLNLIGIMDSGITGINNIWTNTREVTVNSDDDDLNGLVDDIHGWNFVNNSNNINAIVLTPETGVSLNHGSKIAYLVERTSNFKDHKLVPMKVLKENKDGQLFDALCAMSYARKIDSPTRKLKVINASWGYYGKISYPLVKAIEKLKDRNIFLVTAAGNSDTTSDNCERIKPEELRNLTLRKTKFYPACLSKSYKNVISVTTVDIKPGSYCNPCPKQNFSNIFVDVGVQNDSLCRFYKKERNRLPESLGWGTSLSAPIVTSLVNKRILNSTSSIENKSALLSISESDNLSRYNLIADDNARSKIRDGKVLIKK